jgi:lysine-N-methylase
LHKIPPTNPPAISPTISPMRPAYAESFRCIGPACEDTCCQGWSVPIDQAAYERYQSLPDIPLRALIDASVLVNIQPVNGAQPASFAKIPMNGANQCPLLTEERLCRIHAELGEEFLSHTCATYPRIVNSMGGFEETALALSCPEAARLVLLDPDLLKLVLPKTGLLKPELPATAQLKPDLLKPELPDLDLPASESPAAVDKQPGCELAETPSAEGIPSLMPWFGPIRQSALALVVNRAYPLWQRLFLLGVFCRRLDAISSGELRRGVPAFLTDFEATVASAALRTAMETLPLDRTAQLDVVLRLAGLLLHRSSVRPRFVECVEAFTAGIGNGPGATLESLTARYAEAHDRYYEPFLRRHPHILENFLSNTIFRCRFPLGREGAPAGRPHSMAREFALLTAQFALMKGLLIGVAGFHRDEFSAARVVHTIQAASKHFEHHPEFLGLAYELLVESRMDGARGLAILLRNAAPEAAPGAARPASAEPQAPVLQTKAQAPVL